MTTSSLNFTIFDSTYFLPSNWQGNWVPCIWSWQNLFILPFSHLPTSDLFSGLVIALTLIWDFFCLVHNAIPLYRHKWYRRLFIQDSIQESWSYSGKIMKALHRMGGNLHNSTVMITDNFPTNAASFWKRNYCFFFFLGIHLKKPSHDELRQKNVVHTRK